jgi:hypothetical protein
MVQYHGYDGGAFNVANSLRWNGHRCASHSYNWDDSSSYCYQGYHSSSYSHNGSGSTHGNQSYGSSYCYQGYYSRGHGYDRYDRQHDPRCPHGLQ